MVLNPTPINWCVNIHIFSTPKSGGDAYLQWGSNSYWLYLKCKTNTKCLHCEFWLNCPFASMAAISNENIIVIKNELFHECTCLPWKKWIFMIICSSHTCLWIKVMNIHAILLWNQLLGVLSLIVFRCILLPELDCLNRSICLSLNHEVLQLMKPF